MHESIGKMISLLSRNGERYLATKLQKYDLGFGQMHILVVIDPGKSFKQVEIAELVGVDTTTMARSIKKLESMEYLQRTVNPNDPRAYHISLTEKGETIRHDVTRILQNYSDTLLSGFSGQETETLFALVNKLLVNSKNLLSKKGMI